MIVMKFGGTSVQDAAAIDRAAAVVRARLPEKPVVVVSALSKVTDALLATGRAAGNGDRDGALDLARALRERHYTTASELLGTSVFTGFHAELEADFDALDELLRGIAAVGEITPRTSDLVVSFGERLSSKITASTLQARGMDAVHLDARDLLVTDGAHTTVVTYPHGPNNPVFTYTNTNVVRAWVYSDGNDPYRPSAVYDGNDVFLSHAAHKQVAGNNNRLLCRRKNGLGFHVFAALATLLRILECSQMGIARLEVDLTNER